jgi:hypothetical protein
MTVVLAWVYDRKYKRAYQNACSPPMPNLNIKNAWRVSETTSSKIILAIQTKEGHSISSTLHLPCWI